MTLKKQCLTLLILIFCFLLATTLSADETTKQKKLFELIHLLKVKEIFRDERQLCEKQSENYSPENIYTQQPEYFRGITPSDPSWKEIVASYEKYVDTVCSCISEKEYIELHANLYGQYVTENELDVILKFLRSPIGQKDIHAGLMVRKSASQYMFRKVSEVETKANANYMAELGRIISKYQKE